MKSLSMATAGAVFIALGMLGEMQQASAASIIQDRSDDTYEILSFSLIGQTFTAEDTFIKSIGFYVRDLSPRIAPNDFSVRVGLYKEISGTFAFLGSGVFENLVDGFQGYADVDFSSIPLTVGEIYFATIENNTPRWGVEIAGRDPYPGGFAIYGGSRRDSNNNDLRFRVLADDTQPVPEPASAVGLLAFGTLGVGSFLKRRQKKAAAIS